MRHTRCLSDWSSDVCSSDLAAMFNVIFEGTSKMTLNIAANAPRGRQDIRVTTPKGYSNLVPFDVQEIPNFFEAEPNNDRSEERRVGKAGRSRWPPYH